MKLAKLSLAAIVVAGLSTSSFAADTLADAFKEGKVSGELKAYYFDADYGDSSGDIFTTGLMLNYKTGSLNGFSLNFTGQAASSPFADVDGKDIYDGSMWTSGAVLSEAYVEYTLKNTIVRVGRMFLDTPLVASSGNRVVKQAFEGAAVINTDLPNTTLIAGYVQKFQARGAGDGKIGTFTKSFGTGSGVVEAIDSNIPVEDGAYTLAAINKSISGLTLTAAYANVVDIIQVGYAEAAYELNANAFTYGLAAQYYYNNIDNAFADLDNNNLWGVKASVGYGAFGAYAAYSKVNNKTNGVGVTPGLGGGADLAYTGSPINSSSYFNGTKAYKVGATYAVLANANVGVSYTANDVPTNNVLNTMLGAGEGDAYKASFTAIEADYAFEGALKGLSVSVVYEDMGKDADGNEMWAKANYKF